MWDWVITYWVQVLFGAIAAGLGLLSRKFWTMYKNEKQDATAANMQKCYNKIRISIENLETKISKREDAIFAKIQEEHDNAQKHDEEIKNDVKSMVDNIEILKQGILVIEGAYFCQECEMLLERDGIITVDEFKKVTADHNAYNALGGNHTGDALYASVKQKFDAQHL